MKKTIDNDYELFMEHHNKQTPEERIKERIAGLYDSFITFSHILNPAKYTKGKRQIDKLLKNIGLELTDENRAIVEREIKIHDDRLTQLKLKTK